MKILLATLAIEPESRNENNRNSAYSLGIAYLHAILEQANHEVRALYLNNIEYSSSDTEFFSEIEKFQPEIVGVQIFSMNRVATFSTIEKLHLLSPKTKIVLGGIHASVMYEQILRKFPYVVIVIGEGEVTILELVEAISGKRNLAKVKGIAYYSDGSVKVTPERALIEDLDSLPEPKHEVLFDNEPTRTIGHIIASRGCPFDCTFCCLKIISKRRYRKRSVKNVLKEIKNIKAKYPRLLEIQFHDDTLLLDNKRVIELCKLIINENLNLKFVCSARVKPVSHEMFRWMEKAGFYKIMFGLETGSPKLLESIHKQINKKDVLDLFKILKSYNFDITTFLMCGFPGEDDSTIKETIDLVRATQKIKYNLIAGIGKLMVYPGTDIYRVMCEAGKIDDEFWLTDASVPLFTVEHSFKELEVFERMLMDNLSLFNIFTGRGFLQHFMSMPFIIFHEFFLPGGKKLLLSVFAISFQRKFPKIYSKIYKTYLRIRSKE